MAEEFKEEQPSDTMFQDAVEALRRGDKPRAKEILTLLLKSDQNNPTYWIWLSAAVDNVKERIYCLQTALKLDPENGTAKRGLILLGALAPDESIQPFPMNRPRAWEDKLLLANEKPKERGVKVFARSPLVRLIGVMVIGAALLSVVVFGFILPRQTNVAPTQTNTPGPSPTFTATPTVFGATAAPTRSFIGPTPLWMLLAETYTPTPLYVNTPRAPQAADQYRTAKQAYENEDWESFIANMKLIIPYEPESADIYYLIGEAYRFQGQSANALEAYNEALKINPDFGAPYLGLARARLLADPGFNAEFLFDEAIKRDPNFGEAYLERARFFISQNDPEAGIVDLNRAAALMPESSDVYLAYASAYLELEENESALEAAEKAYSLDITALPVYKMLGELYLEDGQYQRAVEAFEVYVIYEEEDALSLARLGQAYYEIEEYESAIRTLDKATTINRTGLRRFYMYRGLANLELGNAEEAVKDLEVAVDVDDRSYEANLGLVRAYYAQGKYGSAFLKVEVLKSVAETDEETATMLYWRALIQEQRGETRDAIRNWNELLDMDEAVITAEMRQKAEERLKVLIPPTRTPKAGTSTPTPRTNATPTRTPVNTPTP